MKPARLRVRFGKARASSRASVLQRLTRAGVERLLRRLGERRIASLALVFLRSVRMKPQSTRKAMMVRL